MGSSNFKHDIPMYADLYLQGRMNLDDLVSKKIALRDVNDGYSALKGSSLRFRPVRALSSTQRTAVIHDVWTLTR